MSHIYSINSTKRIWLAVILSILLIHILSRVFKLTLQSNPSRPIKSRHASANQRMMFKASFWKLFSAFARSFTAGNKIDKNGKKQKNTALQKNFTLLTLKWSISQNVRLVKIYALKSKRVLRGSDAGIQIRQFFDIAIAIAIAVF